MLIALPIGLLIGHTGKGTSCRRRAGQLAARAAHDRSAHLLRGLISILRRHIHGKSDAAYLIPTEIVLVLLAIPSILANTYAGVQNVDPAARDAARGMGMTGSQVLFKVELPARCR